MVPQQSSKPVTVVKFTTVTGPTREMLECIFRVWPASVHSSMGALQFLHAASVFVVAYLVEGAVYTQLDRPVASAAPACVARMVPIGEVPRATGTADLAMRTTEHL